MKNSMQPIRGAGSGALAIGAAAKADMTHVIANYLQGAMSGLSAITVGRLVYHVTVQRADAVTVRVRVNQGSGAPLLYVIQLSEQPG
jgi:hypothetical protein